MSPLNPFRIKCPKGFIKHFPVGILTNINRCIALNAYCFSFVFILLASHQTSHCPCTKENIYTEGYVLAEKPYKKQSSTTC